MLREQWGMFPFPGPLLTRASSPSEGTERVPDTDSRSVPLLQHKL